MSKVTIMKRKRLPFEMTEKQKRHIKGHNLFSIKVYKQASVKPSKFERELPEAYDFR